MSHFPETFCASLVYCNLLMPGPTFCSVFSLSWHIPHHLGSFPTSSLKTYSSTSFVLPECLITGLAESSVNSCRTKSLIWNFQYLHFSPIQSPQFRGVSWNDSQLLAPSQADFFQIIYMLHSFPACTTNTFILKEHFASCIGPKTCDNVYYCST